MATDRTDESTGQTDDNPPPDNRRPESGPVNDQAAVELIRQKVANLYREEPDATHELVEAERSSAGRSKHQAFMYKLGTSGKDLATIQTEWHNYYQKLPTEEKHQVWQEFYASQSLLTGTAAAGRQNAQAVSRHKRQAAKPARSRDSRRAQDVRAAIRRKVTADGKLEAKHHVQSLLFGLAMGLIVVVIFLFGFFNEVFIAPFIQPSRTATATPLIISSDNSATNIGPQVIIPKINVQIPVDYSETSTDENVIENDLQNGVVHYPTTVAPGQIGNAAFFGHSSNNIFNKGKYKFAFVLLHTLVPGDTFYLSYNGKMYVYKVISRQIVDPSNVSVLNAVQGQTATATLITCDPPGTSFHRLVVVGQQISPDPSTNAQVASSATPPAPADLPGNGPTLWSRFIGTAVGKIMAVGLVGLAAWVGARRLSQLFSGST